MASSSSQRFAFPLPERALPRIQISPEQHEELRAFAVRSAHDVLRDGPTWGRSNVQAARERGWKVSQRTPDVCFMMKTTTNDKPSASSSTGSNMGSSRGFRAAPSSAGSPSESSSSSPPVAEDGTPGRRITSGGAGGRAFMGSVRLAGYNLDDVVASLYCETTAATRDQLVKSYGHAYLDCCVLQTLEGAKPHDPFWYLGLKWTALKTPFEKLVNYREFVYLEHSGTHVNAQGQRMLYRILQSVKLEEFGGEPAYFGLTRAHLEAAYVYWMDAPSGHVLPDNGVLTVSMRGLAHPKGKVPLWLVERYMKKFWKAGWALQGSDGAAVSKLALDDQLALDLATEWVADADRKACALCQKKFRFGRRMRHHCRACGEVICRNCTQYFLLTYPTSTATTTTTATGGSVAGTFPYQNFSEGGETQSQRKRAQNGFRGFLDQDDDDDMPATLGDNRTLSQSRLRLGRGMSGAAGGSTRGGDRGRQRGASDNDAVMVGKVCRRCVEMKKIAIRRDTSTCGSNPSFIKKQRRGLPRSQSWEPNSIHNTGGGGHHLLKPQPIHEHQDEDREEHEALPIMGHDDESDTEYFAPETPGPIINHGFYHNYNQQPGHDQDDTASEFSVGDFEASQAFKSYANAQTTAASGYPSLAIGEDKIGTSLGSRFSQSGFSVGINVHEDDSDDDDQGGEVDYHSDPEQQPAAPAQAKRVHHPQLGQLTQLTVEEEERFTSSQPRVQQPMMPPPPVAQNFVLNAAALHAQRYKEDARLRIEDLLADTDDEGEGEGDYSTSPPMRPSALDISIHEMRPQPHLIRTASAPATTANNNNNQYQRERFAPPPPPPQPMAPSNHHASIEDDVTALPQLGKVHISANRDQNRESNLSTLSFSSFDADMLIDATAFDEDDDDHIRRMSTTIDGDEADEDDVLFARIQKIQDEVLRRQLLASSDASSLASSLASSYGPTPIRLNRNGRVASNANNGTSLSDGSTISSTDSFGSTAPLEFVRQSSAPQIAGHKAHKVAQLQVASAIEEQAQLLYRIQMERDRVASDAEARGNGVRLY